MVQLTDKSYIDTEQSTVNTLVASAAIFEGSALGSTSGLARQLVAGDVFLGFAKENAAVGADVQIDPPGQAIRKILPVVGVVAGSVGASVYASDGATFTLTSASNTLIGTVLRVVSGTTVVVQT